MSKHWSEQYQCICGKRFRSYVEEARHRHNFPLLCRRKKRWKKEDYERVRTGE